MSESGTGGGDSVTYKSIVIALLSIAVGLVSFIGIGALGKLDRLELIVVTMQATKSVDDMKQAELMKKVEQLTNRMDTTDRQLTPQVEFLTKWLVQTFGAPRPKSQSKFGTQ